MKRRFFFHYHKSTGGATVHFRGQCIQCKDIEIIGIKHLESKHNKRQPRWVVRGFADKVEVKNGIAIIS